MSNVTQVAGKAIPVRGNDIDTDRIIPARFMRTITFEGLGEYAFYDERFDSQKKPKKHVFNEKKFSGASILIVNKNFGCGSSREHAPQALAKWGMKSVIGESFAEIFSGNCQMMGIPAVIASEADVKSLQDFVEKDPELMVNINVEEKKLSYGDMSFPIEIPEGKRQSLVLGTWDTTGMLVQNLDRTKKLVKKIPYLNKFG